MSDAADPLATVDALYDRTLQPRIAGLEGLRTELRGYFVRAGMLIGIPCAIFYFRDLITWVLPELLGNIVRTGSFIAIFVGVFIAGWKYLIPGITAYANYRGRFKAEIVSEIVKVVCPTATYAPGQGVPAAIFDSPGIFAKGASYETDDRIRGTIGQTPFEAADVHRWYSSGSGKDSKTYHVFQGLFFHFDFNKALGGITIVQPESASAYQIGSRSGLNLVSLENPDFEKEFKVYSNSEVEARYVLTPAMMERLLAVRAEADRPLFLGFRDNGAYLGVHYGRSLFEPGIAETTSKGAILEMAQHFALAEVIVSELDLNTRIWTKTVDSSLLQAPDEAPKTFFDAAAASGGTMTSKDILAGAGLSLGEEYRKEIGVEIPRPARARTKIVRDAGRTSVRYPWTIGALFMMLVSLASIGIALSALRQIGRDGSVPLGPLAARLAQLPTWPRFDGLVGEYGIGWLIGAMIVGSLFTLGWLLRVRRVDVMPAETLVYRGLRPFPHRYSRTSYPAILRMKNSVHLSKGAGLSLMNPTASPNLSEAEAGWVASELRKSLQA